MTVTVLLADDQPLLRKGFRMILEEEPDIAVVAEVDNGEEAVARSHECRPDVVLMDVRMPVMDGIEATRRIVAAGSPARILVLTTFDLDEYAFGALQAGASGFLLKDAQPHELVRAIRIVASGDAIVSPRITRKLLDRYAPLMTSDDPGDESPEHRTPSAFDELTDREREVLVALADGLSNAEIGDRLYVSEATVKTHVGRILSKLGLRDRVQAVVAAYKAGLVRPS
jgi:DNA-binding NarL/FixJ family response regulator